MLLDTEKRMLGHLITLGYNYAGINDLFEQKSLPNDVVGVILKYYRDIFKEHLGSGDQLIRSLLAATEPFNPSDLINFFEENKYSKSIMWSVAHVLAQSKTYDISAWIKDQLINRPATFERSGLVSGLAVKGGFSNQNDYKTFLQEIFDKYPIEVLELFKKDGIGEDIIYLELKAKSSERKLAGDILKVINVIKKRKKL